MDHHHIMTDRDAPDTFDASDAHADADADAHVDARSDSPAGPLTGPPTGPPTGIEDSPQRHQQRRHIDDKAVRDFIIAAARLMADSHCEHILVFDVQGKSDVTDYIVIASGTSDRQMRSVGDDLEKLAREHGLSRFGRDVDGATTWLVLDFIDAVVHLFDPATRAHYDLEMMWGDAPKVTWQRDR